MAKVKITKSAVDAAQPQAQPVERRDTLVPCFLCKITVAGRKVFILQYRPNASERRKPALSLYAELTVEQARSRAQNWLPEVHRGGDSRGDKAQARQIPTLLHARNKPSTQHCHQSVIDRHIIPLLGRMKVQDVKRPDVAAMIQKMTHKPANANRAFSVMRQMFNLAEVWVIGPMAPISAAMFRFSRLANPSNSSATRGWASYSGILNSWRPRRWSLALSHWQSACSSSSPPSVPTLSFANGHRWIWSNGA